MNSEELRVAINNAMPTPRVSVVIGSYQSERYIAQAIESVLNQSLKDVEVLVQDDASTDRTVEIASSYAHRGVRVCVNSVRSGPVASFNAGIAATIAPFVVKLDADDWLLPEHLAECDRALRENPDCTFAFTQVYRYRDGRMGGIKPDWPHDRVFDGRDFFLAALHHGGTPCAASSVMFRRRAFLAVGGFKDRGLFLPYGDDLDLWLRLCTKGPVAYVSRSLAVYQIHEGSWTASICGTLKRRPFRVLAEAVEENARSALKSGVLQQGDWPVVAKLLARRWMSAADVCAFLPEDRKLCLERACKLSVRTVLCSRHSWRLLAKLILGLRWTEELRTRREA